MVLILVAELCDVLVAVMGVFLQHIIWPGVHCRGFLCIFRLLLVILQSVVGIVLAQHFHEHLCTSASYLGEGQETVSY